MTKVYKLSKSEWGLETGKIVYAFEGETTPFEPGTIPIVIFHLFAKTGPYLTVPETSLEQIGDTNALPPVAAPRPLLFNTRTEEALYNDLDLARRLLAGCEDRLFILEDFEIARDRKTGKWKVVHATITIDEQFVNPLDAAIEIKRAKDMAAIAAAPDSTIIVMEEFGQNPELQSKVLDTLRNAAPLSFRGTPLITNPTLGGPEA